MDGQHALPARRRRRDSNCPLRRFQRWPFEDDLPHWPQPSLWPPNADHQRHSLQFLAAGSALAGDCGMSRRKRGSRFHRPCVLRPDTQLSPLLMALDLPVRRLAGGLPVVPATRLLGASGRQLGDARRRHAVPALGNLIENGAAWLSKRRPSFAAHFLQQLGAIRRDHARCVDHALSGLRGHWHEGAIDFRGGRISPAFHRALANRERVLRHDTAQAPHPLRRATAGGAARSRRGVRGTALFGFGPLPAVGNRRHHLSGSGRISSLLPA